MKKAAIVIVNWNGKKFLRNCLDSVYKQTYKNFQLYFVDNGSIDGSSEFVKRNYPKTIIIQLDKNYGFAKPNNIAIKEAFKDKLIEYIVCLNNDTIVDNNWLKELIKTTQKDKRIGAVSSKAYFPDGRIQNAGLSLEKALQINKEGGISIGYGLTDKEAPNLSEEIEIFAPGGVAPLYKREILEQIYGELKNLESTHSPGHELSHLIEQNHSESFWSLVKKAMPNYKEKKKWLKENRKKLKF